MARRISYDTYDFFSIRAPLLPVEKLSGIPSDEISMLGFIREIWRSELIRACLYVASPSFYREFEKMVLTINLQESHLKMMMGFIRYYERMCARSTPFGMFAGFNTGITGDLFNCSISPPGDHILSLRADMDYLLKVSCWLASHDLKELLKYKPNTSAYLTGHNWKYIEVSFDGQGHKVYEMVQIQDDGILKDLVEFAKEGCTVSELINHVCEWGWELPEVKDYIGHLIDSQFFVSQLEPVLTGIEYMHFLRDQLEGWNDNIESVATVDHLFSSLEGIKSHSMLFGMMDSIQTAAKRIPVTCHENSLLQVDMCLHAKRLAIDKGTTNRILLGIRIRKALARNEVDDPLKGFKEAFEQKFGDAEIPMVVALDPETGIGLDGSEVHYWTDPVAWVDDIKWPSGNGIEEDLQGNFKKTKVAWPGNETEWYETIDRNQLKQLDIHEGSWPDQLFAMVELFNDKKPERQGINFIHSSDGHPAHLLARFGFLDEGKTQSWLSQMIQDEISSRPDLIFAEIIHMPENRAGNVLQRPTIYPFEITYLAGSILDVDHVITVDDLLLKLQKNKIILTSRKWQKRVIPKLTTAHNFENSYLPIYRFLSMLAFQERVANFSPERILFHSDEFFSAGLSYDEIHLTHPLWQISAKTLKTVIEDQSAQKQQLMTLFLREHGLPQKVLWMHHDQELYIDWDNPLIVESAWEVMKHHKWLKFRPYLFENGSPVMGETGSFANQLIVAFRKTYD